jgi:hypothetical protein
MKISLVQDQAIAARMAAWGQAQPRGKLRPLENTSPAPIAATIGLESVTTRLELFADVARLRRPDRCEKTLDFLLQTLGLLCEFAG